MGPLYLALLSEKFERELFVFPTFLNTVQSCRMEGSLCTWEEAVSAPPLSLACVCTILNTNRTSQNQGNDIFFFSAHPQ